MPENKTIEELIRIHEAKGLHFFEAGAMKHFDSIIYPEVYTGSDGWYFTTSERFRGSTASGPRLYAARRMNAESLNISTLTSFSNTNALTGELYDPSKPGRMATHAEALQFAQQAAQDSYKETE